MDDMTRKRLGSIDPRAHAVAASRRTDREARRAQVIEVLRRHGADPAQALMSDGMIVVDGNKDQYMAGCRGDREWRGGQRPIMLDFKDPADP